MESGADQLFIHFYYEIYQFVFIFIHPLYHVIGCILVKFDIMQINLR